MLQNNFEIDFATMKNWYYYVPGGNLWLTTY